MKACSTAGGGVMFIPEKIERKGAAISYGSLLKEEKITKKLRAFGKRRVEKKAARRAA